MKGFGQLKQELTESVTQERQRLDALVRAGLLDKSQLLKLHHALDKIAEEKPLSSVERQLIFDLVDQFIHLATNNTSVFQKLRQAIKTESIVPNEQLLDENISDALAAITQQPPPMLVFRRKSVRSYPGDVWVALYYNDRLDRYVSVPYHSNAQE